MSAVSPVAFARESIRSEPGPAVLASVHGKDARRLGSKRSVRSAQEDVAEQLAALANMERNDLIALWRKQFRSSPPDRIRRDLLELGIAWKLREKAFGGLKKSIVSELRRLCEDLAETGDIRRAEAPLLKPGTRLLREWGGFTHEVVILDDGFLWKDKSWTSLSAIAKAITGAHWSGPRFFGLKKRSSPGPAQEVVPNADMFQFGAVAPAEAAATTAEEALADA